MKNAVELRENTAVWKKLSEKLRNLFTPENLPGVFGAAFAFLMMFFHPLIYDNYFFNIN